MYFHRNIVVYVLLLGFCQVNLSSENEDTILHRQRRQTSCFARLGCFSNDPPYNNTIELPQDPNFINTTFKLYTRTNPNHPSFLFTHSAESVHRSRFDSSKPVRIIIHGFLQSTRLPWVVEMVQKLLQAEPQNVIAVEWGQGAGFPYTQAAANTRLVGAEVANLVAHLCHVTGISRRQFHMIGHSLGAHVAGYAGNRLPGMGRISGLDPAQPNFEHEHPQVRLDPTDADVVDVIHTDDTRYHEVGGFGMRSPVGHMDFYPNGGHYQPGCETDTISNVLSDAINHGIEDAEVVMGCSHDRAVHLFIESINSQCHFTGYTCSSMEDFRHGICYHCGNRPCPSMGYKASHYKSRGIFYLATCGHSPFCVAQYFVEVDLSQHMTNLRGEVKVQLHGSRGNTDVSEIFRGFIQHGAALHGVVVSGSEIGEVQRVTIFYAYARTFFHWGDSPSLVVERVKVLSARRRTRVQFCSDVTITDGGTGVLTNPTRRCR
ncbi:inactive pancreatic lipase-related protein 1-like [Gigantopelta aegis]|uniref:inactive pancreatic lipase-related protein 1-like n=1 Tax=Gigantopelta aegis TaxID=1735272 RepID=UPI001B88A8CF|nr:inactive pancreatic lipase-related protein 1-like [Gigantopelta aegis]